TRCGCRPGSRSPTPGCSTARRPRTTTPCWWTCRSTPLRRLELPETLADHAGDAVAAHADAVEGVGDLHRPLLVGDHDQLPGVPQLLDQGEKPAEVDVVEGGLDRVEHVER